MKQEVKEIPYSPVLNSLFGPELPFVRDQNNIVWMPVKDTCLRIGLTESQTKTVLKNCNKDPFLKLVSCKMKIESPTGAKETVCINYESFIIFLMKLDFLSLPDGAYSIVSKIINKAHKQSVLKDSKEDYYYTQFHKEKLLQDRLFKLGNFHGIKLLEKEKIYDFGRIDIYGIDADSNKVCIELKKGIEFSDTKEQLLRYKNSKVFDRVIYIANKISDDFKAFLEENDIEFLQYKINLNSHIVELY